MALWWLAPSATTCTQPVAAYDWPKAACATAAAVYFVVYRSLLSAFKEGEVYAPKGINLRPAMGIISHALV